MIAYGVVTLLGMLLFAVGCAVPAAVCVAIAIFMCFRDEVPARPKPRRHARA